MKVDARARLTGAPLYIDSHWAGTGRAMGALSFGTDSKIIGPVTQKSGIVCENNCKMQRTVNIRGLK